MTIAHLTINQRVRLGQQEQALCESFVLTVFSTLYDNGSYLHNVEEHLLAQTILLFKEVVLRVSAGDVSANQLFTGRRHLEELRVLVFDGHILGVTQELPDYCPEVVWNPFSDEILW